MANKTSFHGQIIKEHIKKYPQRPARTLAREIFNKHKEYFTNYDHCYSMVRYNLGVMGDKERRSLKDKELMREPRPNINPFNLPESYECDWIPFRLYPHNSNILMLCDLHIPYHTIEAVTLALKYGKKKGINTIVLDGDILDFHMLSSFCKDMTKRSVKQEFIAGIQFLNILRKEFPKADIIYKYGNHEERYPKYLMSKCVELWDIEEFRIEKLLGLDDCGIKYVGDKRVIKCGENLNILHGHEFFSSPIAVNPARSAFTKAKCITMVGHHHRTSEHTETTLNNDIITCWSVGCLCELHPAYMPINNWNHGFAIIERESENNFHIENKRIHNGNVL